MSHTRFEDALADLATPASYVPRPDMERARRVLEAALVAGGRPALVTGEPGSGKTLLLRRLAASPPAGVQAFHVPFLHLGPDEFAPWLLFLMGEDGFDEPAAAERRLVERVWEQAAAGWRTWLLIDEAPSLPRATAARLARLVERCEGRLALALAATSRSAVRDVLDCFSGPSATADLSGGDGAAATRSYVEALVSRAAPEERERAQRAAARLGPLAERLPRDVKAQLLRRWRESAEEPPTAPAPPEEPPSPAPAPEPLTLELPKAGDLAGAPPPQALVRAIQEAEAELDLAESSPLAPELDVPEPKPPRSTPVADPALRPASRPRRPRARPTAERPARRHRAAERAPRRRVAPLVGALVVLGLIAIGLRHWGSERPAAPPAAVQPASTASAPQAEGGATPVQSAAAPIPVAVNVNAAPWARIRVDGRDVGVTPLGGVPLDPGAHEFRASFPDGRIVVRTVDVSASNRFVVFR